jgi:hypothetical protein
VGNGLDHRTPYELLADGGKTTLTAPGGVVLGYGPGPGLSQAIFWNRVGSLFSCYRPALAQLTPFDCANLHEPAALRKTSFAWEPNHVHAEWAADGLALSEDRLATHSGLCATLTARNVSRGKRAWLLFFHGQVQQWPFFDYWKGAGEPLVKCEIAPAAGRVVLTQPHPHHGLPELSSVQTLALSRPFACYGFGLGEGDLRALWHDHGCLASLRLRLGQVGGRFTAAQAGRDVVPARAGSGAAPVSFSHRHPLYYFGVRLTLKPGQEAALSLRCEFHTTDEEEHAPQATKVAEATAASAQAAQARLRAFDLTRAISRQREEWREYMERGVPQLECSDAELERYWYYVWYVLRANRTAPGRHVTHPFTAPSKYLYWGPWIWDGYFHALGEMWLQDPGVAQDTIRAVLDMQYPNGYLPVCSGSNYRMCFHDAAPGYKPAGEEGYASYVQPALAEYREGAHPFEAEFEYETGRGGFQPPTSGRRQNAAATAMPAGSPRSQDGGQGRPPHGRMLHTEKTQTPLIAVAAALYCLLRGDAAFAREVLPALWAYEEWLWRRRTDRQGRFILWDGDESGWDNATRHFPVPAKPVDVQVHCVMHRRALAELARLAGDAATAAEAQRRAQISLQALRTYWDANDEWHYDFAATGGGQRTAKRRKQIAPSGIFPLLVEQRQSTVDAVLRALSHPRVFGTAFPIPTLAACDPDYAPHGWGWNGPAWLQVNYFAIVGLLKAGQPAAALALWQQTRALIIRDGAPCSYEMYDPELGTGIGCPDYSWQAMINHLVIHHFAGVPVGGGVVTPCLPEGLRYLRLSNLPGRVGGIELERARSGHLRIAVHSAEPPRFDLRGLGRVTNVKLNGRPTEPCDGLFTFPAPRTGASDWVLIAVAAREG